MKVKIEATQEELDQKRPELIKALAGKKFKVSLRPAQESIAGEPREPFYKAQAEMIDHWDKLYNQTIEDIINDINEVIG